VFLFSGHMIDAPGRKQPRFPPEKEPIAARAIAAKLDELGAGPGDIAICGGACGGDLIFAEESLKRGLHLRIHISFDEEEFLNRSIRFAGKEWVSRYNKARSHENTRLLVMPQEAGAGPEATDPYERNNLWQLDSAFSYGPSAKVHFICLWNGEGGDGPGGTRHMHEAVLEHSGNAHVLDTTKLW
jgi:hypothetical protein